MKTTRIEALLVAARPERSRVSHSFTDAVMQRIHQPEIITSQLRRMNDTKKESFIMKLRHLPKLAIIAIAAGALLIISTGTYAAYQLLWPKPDIEVSQPVTSISGREEVEILVGQCGDEKLADRYELKKNAPITADEIGQVVKAHCELQAVQTWANDTFPNNSHEFHSVQTEPYTMVQVTASMATTLKAKDSKTLTFTGLTKYHLEDEVFEIPSGVRYIVDGHEASLNDIAEGDNVTYVTSSESLMVPREDCTPTSCGYSSDSTTKTLVAVVKLSMPLKYYDQLAWQSLAERVSCFGNPNDSCLTGYVGGIEVFTPHAGLKNPEVEEMKEIQGVVTELRGTTTKIKSSSGTIFTIKTTRDVVSAYNNGRAVKYFNNQTVKLGSTLRISYIEAKGESNKTITENQLSGFMLQMEMISKGDVPSAY